MVKIDINDVEHGMVTAQDVSNQPGRLLLPRGVAISEEHIRIMRAYGVRTVDIVSDTPTPAMDASLFEETEARCRELLRPRFAALDLTKPFGQEVFALAARRAAARVLDTGYDLDAAQTNGILLSLPPELGLFNAKATAPESLVAQDVELATLPEVYARLLEALGIENSTPQELAAIIGRDPSLTARLLKLVNSPHYGSRTPVDSISRAVAMVGRHELTTLVLGLAAISAFTDINPELWDMRAFWRHAASCAVYATLLSAIAPGTAAPRVFVGGLLHDIGQLVIVHKLPAAASRALLLARIEGLPIDQAETAVLGFDHQAVGKALLANWHFPETLTAMVANHHQPNGRPDARETAIIHVADILATAWDWPAFSALPVPSLSEAAWASLDIDLTLLPTVAEAGDTRIQDIESVFFSAPTAPCQ